MRTARPAELGDEPIYCETRHDDHAYSGSEDDYYEAPEHRRMRIEAKAIQFLDGHVPYLLSAKLKGPFDKTSWNNPWMSKRAQQGARHRVNASRRSATTVEIPRGHGSGNTTNDLPDTQRTSLYPLPSPETTNPPSARKNEFMDESGYNRIKSWREAVTSIPLSRDPFWASQLGGSQQKPVAKKRPAEDEWLRTRDSRRRKLAENRTSLTTESPSQAAARAKKSRVQFSEITNQSGPIFNSKKSILAPRCDDKTGSFGSSQLSNAPTTMPDLSQTPCKSPLSGRRRPHWQADASEDEISMSSTMSPMKALRLSGSHSTSPARRRLLSHLDPSTSVGSARRTPLQETEVRENGNDITPYLPLESGRLVAEDGGKDLVRHATSRALCSSQQDDSFYFHKKVREPMAYAEPRGPTPFDPESGHSNLPAQTHAPPSTSKYMAERSHAAELGPDTALGKTSAVAQIQVLNKDGRDGVFESVSLCEPAAKANTGVYKTIERADDSAMAPQHRKASAANTSQSHHNPDATSVEHEKQCQFLSKSDVDLPAFACTQELSPVSMHSVPRCSGQPSTVVNPGIAARQCPFPTDHEVLSDIQWLTRDRKGEDFSSAPAKMPTSQFGVIEEAEAASQKTGEGNDSDWATFDDSQESMAEPQTEEGANGHHLIEVVHRNHNDVSESEWSTILNSQAETGGAYRSHENLNEDTKRVDTNQHEDKILAAENDMETNSEWSTCMSEYSHIIADETGDTSHEPALAVKAVSEEQTPDKCGSESQHAHADSEQARSSSEGGFIVKTVQGSLDIAPSPKDSITLYEETGPKQDDSGLVDRHENIPVVAGQPESHDQSLSQTMKVNKELPTDIDETTASFESVQPEIPRDEQTRPASQNRTPWKRLPADSVVTHNTPSSNRTRDLQSPWDHPGSINLPASTTLHDPAVIERIDTINETSPCPFQSPWAKECADPSYNDNLNHQKCPAERQPDLSMIVEDVLTFSETPQLPWLGDKLPSPRSPLSVKRFSDFMKPSPTKKRAPAIRSILHESNSSSRLLFEKPVAQAVPRRCVSFAPLLGAGSTSFSEAQTQDNDECYVEEDVSYFDTKGEKTSSVRVARPSVRACSPPPAQVNPSEAGELPDHDHKFANHFEAMSKRQKNPTRKIMRLLSQESQLAEASQDVGAMAEAFIEASQTNKIPVELPTTEMDRLHKSDKPAGEDVVDSLAIKRKEEQENVDPVDDVSAVLDNLSDFLDNTWGVDLSMEADAEATAPVQGQQARSALNRIDHVGDPLLSLNFNIWAD